MLTITYDDGGIYVKWWKFVAFLLLSAIVLSSCQAQNPWAEIVWEGNPIQSCTLFAGQEVQFSAGEGAEGQWSSSDHTVVIVEPDGYVRAKQEGTATITLTVGKQTASATITVTPYIAVEEVKPVTQEMVIKAGGQKKLRLTVLPENASDPSLIYSVEPNDGILTIADGMLCASENAQPETEYQLTATNLRSGISATMTVKISKWTGLTAWTIGDSIFDFQDNYDDAMVQTMLKEAGYTNLMMDNIAGSTVRAASGVGIIDHIHGGWYESWPEPDLIILFRGTNDAYFGIQQPNFFTPSSIEQAVKETCIYFSQHYPDARIVWATPLWRRDVSAEQLDVIRQHLHTYCPQYGIEVFDLHLTEEFASLSEDNCWSLLVDGIHLTDLGATKMKEAVVRYLTQ